MICHFGLFLTPKKKKKGYKALNYIYILNNINDLPLWAVSHPKKKKKKRGYKALNYIYILKNIKYLIYTYGEVR